ncbi:putative casein kinase 2, alpha subunit [Histomonas meleagridis]|uniref:putative casein kinase 2, alpha subunit n=1 Tax=Histomonas meleagridis TaxID=135588 RepID=UPI00355963AC|nr:putative casein kinase 2, alpha subunit [Histomonas meleagridis]KAH0801477.1 putative casein kinase 2, alpha subunit [Histomonas meleagridis]
MRKSQNPGTSPNEDSTKSYQFGDIDKYYICNRVGRGKYSNVFRGKTENGQLCVIKVLKPVRPDRIQREINILRRMRGAPNTSQLLDVVSDKDTKSIALILDWSKNVPIRTILRHLTTVQISTYIYKVLQSLEYAHSHNIMHRDVKPGNIMFDPDTLTVSLIDWGLAEEYQPDREYLVRVATKHYKGPELLLGYTKYDTSLDIWCLGCTFATLLFGRIPFFKGHDNDDQVIRLGEIFGCRDIVNYVEKYSLTLPPNVATKIQKYKKKSFASFVTEYNKDVATPEALDLLSKMLVIDHKQRITAVEAMKHPYFEQANI